MSSFNFQSSGTNDINSVLTQFRRQRDAETPDSAHKLSNRELSQFSSFNNQGSQPIYGGNLESPHAKYQSAMESSTFPPAAPTPPVHAFGSSQYPPSMLGMNSPNASQNGQSAELLNLLKLSQQTPRTADSSPAAQNVIHAPVPTADPTGLLAALMKGHMPSKQPKPEPAPASTWNQNSPSDGTQNYLLSLLNRPKPTQNEAPPKSTDAAQAGSLLSPGTKDGMARDQTGNHSGAIPTLPTQAEFHFESFAPRLENNASSPSESATKILPLRQLNPFEDFSGSPRQNSSDTPPASRTGNLSSQTVPMPIVPIIEKPVENPDSAQSNKRTLSDRALSANFAGPDHTRVKLNNAILPVSATSSSHSASRDTAGVADKPPTTEAFSYFVKDFEVAAQDAEKQAMVAAEEYSNEEDEEIAQDLEKMMNAKTDKEFEQSAQHAAKAIKRELEKEGNQAVLKDTMEAELANAVKDIIDQTAQNSAPIADSWESADADEIIVIEETAAPVKVYNFPMKPWISITIRETDQPRALFRDDAILDIARLKKDFDQIDRNLVAASETHLAYGMSKAGGFRVIKQEDGKDARLFTDTKDRIFNVAICSAATDKTPREAVLATGVSGTVYWVLLRNGDREHLDDAHPEQYGFALPPMAGHEGDAPGGALKTRARTSAARPDYFAVGRGKSIHIVWPSFVFRHNLFKAGHDRVVDTDKLLKQCSLKVNTGKAGKDFTLSRDDTVMVTLDKSGRVKFWDVRDLTAVDKDSDPSKPLPAHTSLEVKDPLMTLSTTPEGEKAWPTSVLLLDKLRPYQKLTALRYMIVGMKQNHTLQLWDLALGKVVQEFNFPHSKESDGVCSVAYHAATSMIVVGHPTRNSVYFLHLSAPKYSLKGVSQVDYIQRLEARDSSIPQPDSTAVISGIREYSLSNKGTLRSLTLLENPNAQGDGDEPVLFELYAMHSKGVTCLSIKQMELGWTKKNQVMAPVDAVETGYVKISKLVIMPQDPDPEPEPSVPPQSRTNPRNAKEVAPKTPPSQAEEKRHSATHAVVKVLERPKDDILETPVTPAEKAEKKSRKKKSAANHVVAEVSGSASAPPELSRSTSQKAPTKSSARNIETSTIPTIVCSTETQVISPEVIQSTDSGRLDMETRLVNNLAGRFDKAMANLHGNLEKMEQTQHKRDQKRDREYTISQAQLIDMVAKVLTENTDAALQSIVKDQFQHILVPHMSDQYTKVSSVVADRLTMISKHEVHQAMPAAVQTALQHPDVLRLLSDRIAGDLKAHIDAQTLKAVNMAMSSLLPKMLGQQHQDLNHQVAQQLERQQHIFHENLGTLNATLTNMSGVIQDLASSQMQIKQELDSVKLQLQKQQQQATQSPVQSHAGSHVRAPRPGGAPSATSPQPVQQAQQFQQLPAQQAQHFQQLPIQQAQQLQQLPFYVPDPMGASANERFEMERAVSEISELLRVGNYEEAVINWVRCEKHHDEVFMHAILPYGVAFVAELTPLLLLTVLQLLMSNVDMDMNKMIKGSSLIKPKLGMIEALLQRVAAQLPTMDVQLYAMVPNVITLARTRLETIFMDLQRQYPGDVYLRTLSAMSSTATRILEAAKKGPEAHY